MTRVVMPETTEFFPYPSFRKFPDLARLASTTVLGILILLAAYAGAIPLGWVPEFTVAAISLLCACILLALKGWLSEWSAAREVRVMAIFAEQDSFPCLLADADGRILSANSEAQNRFQARLGSSLNTCLKTTIANPAAVLLRLQSLAEIHGKASEEIVSVGASIPVSVFAVGQNVFCWRFHLDAQSQWTGMSAPVLTLGRNGTVLRANAMAEHVLGCQLVGEKLALGENPPSSGEIARIKTAQGTTSVVFYELSRAGAARDVLILPLAGADSPTSETPFAELPVPVMCLSPEGLVLDANKLATKLVGGVTPYETNVAEVMQGLGYPIHDWLTRAASENAVAGSEFLRLSRQDKEVFVQVTLNRIVNDGQVSLIAILNDATELKTLEAQFVQGQKMQAVGQLAGGVAHDFNNLLTAISGHCDLLLLRHDQNDPNYSDLVQINQNANRAAALVSQLLAFSRKQTLKPEVLDLRDTISDLIHLLNRLVGEKVRLTLSHDPVLKPVRADKRQLEQVFMNLVVNARDAMPEGGEVRIETEVVTLTQPLRRDRAAVQPGEYVTVKVIDSGTGIPADKLQKVFEPFYTTKRTGEGTGLGLSTVYGIVKQTGGFIFVDSIVGRGTEFTVFLPVSTQPQTVEVPHDTPHAAQTGRQGEGVVLLVEDEAPVRAFATRALRLKGYTVLEADSGEEALRLLEDSSLHVDVFVTDVVMPGLDGPTWVRQALTNRPDVQVIFMSGYTEGAFGDSGPEVANSAFLPKPFSLTQLTETVFRQLN